MTVVRTVGASLLVGGAEAAIAAASTLGVLYDEFRDQANEAYNAKYPEHANDTAPEQAADMNRDAYRHTYVSARMSQTVGRDVAHFLGDANEAVNNEYGPGPRIMDYFNNDQGLDIQDTLQSTANIFDVDQALADAVDQRLQSDDLHTSETIPPENYEHEYMVAEDGAIEALADYLQGVGESLVNFFKGFWDFIDGSQGSPNGQGGATNSSIYDSNGDGRNDGTGDTGGGDPVELVPPIPPRKPHIPDDLGSPLVLDLDGDGVELYQVGAYGSYFDLLGTGQAVLTGWVEPDDGLLALDINADGQINDITELFGNVTTDGFTELAAYDSNGDGVIDAADTVFSDLLVWTDTNSDGVSQADELHTLTALGISSISLDAARVAGQEIAGNPITHEATYTLSDGTERAIVDAWFAYDTLYTQNVQDYSFDLRAAFLPTLKGFGDLKDLHMAASLDNGTTPDTLMEQLIAFVDGWTLTDALTDWDSAYADAETLMLRWAGVDGIDPNSRGSYVDARHLAFYEIFRGYEFDQYSSANPLVEAGQFTEAVFQYLVTHAMIQVLAQMDGSSIFASPQYNLWVGGTDGDKTLLQSGIDAVQAAAIAASDGESVWTHFAQFLGYTKGLDNLSASEITALDTAVAASGEPALSDWQDVISLMTASLGSVITSSDDWGSFEVYYDNYNTGTSGDDVMVDDNAGGFTNNEFKGYDGNDTIQGLDGHDKLSGGAGNDILEGGTGDDYLLGGTGNDIYLYESGNDTISEVGGDGVDELHIMASTGLVGSDLIDLYRYGDELILSLSTGDFITVHDYNGTDSRLETIVFDYDATTIDLTSLTEEKYYGTEKADNLNVTGSGIQTQLVYAYGGNDVIQVSASAGLFYGGDGYDTLIGDYLPDIFYGEDGDDYLSGNGGDDVLKGGAGNDYIDGGDGNDTIEGGSYNDKLFGGLGNDDISPGSGNDTVHGGDGDDYIHQYVTSNTGNDVKYIYGDAGNDIIDMADGDDYVYGETGDDVINTNDGDDFIDGGDGNDTIDSGKYDDTIYGGLGNDDITPGSGDDIVYGGDGDDYIHQTSTSSTADDNKYIYGEAGNDIIQLADSDDHIYGGDGDDQMSGNLGNDTVLGGTGNDIYFFNLGDGQDVFEDEDGLNDVIRLGAGIQLSDLILTQVAGTDDLQITFFGDTTDIITLTGQYAPGGDQQFEKIIFDDSTELNLPAVTFIHGTAGADILSGTSGTDYIFALEDDDEVSGGAGDDFLFGAQGNDTLDGGAGNDTYVYALPLQTYIGLPTSDATVRIDNLGMPSDQISVRLKIRSDNMNGDGIVSYAAGSEDNAFLLYHNASLQVVIDGDGLYTGVVLDDGLWHDVVVTWQSSDGALQVYDNGVLSYSGTHATGNQIESGGILMLGQEQDSLGGGLSSSQALNGDIDDFSVWGRVLDLAEISSDIDVNDAIVAFDFNQISGEWVYDLGGTYNGSVVGGVEFNEVTDADLGNGLTIDQTRLLANVQELGTDTLYDVDGVDTISLGSGIKAENINITRSTVDPDDMVITVLGSNILTVTDQFVTGGIETIKLADETVIDLASTLIETHGTASDDTLTGIEIGASPVDTIYGNDGNDTLTGGTADDHLYGGAGSDEYIFNSGDGQDTITDDSGATDLIRLGAGFTEADIVLTDVGTYDLEITFTNSPGDKITILGQRDNTGTAQVEKIVFNDGSELSLVGPAPIEGTAGDDVLTGTSDDDLLQALDGDDTLSGGAGNDTLEGGSGTDTYLWQDGDGDDTISDSDGSRDVISLGSGLRPDDLIITETGTNDLQITFATATGSLILIDQRDSGGTQQIERVRFDDGSELDLVRYQEWVFGTAANDTISGDSAVDDIQIGLDGNDTLYAYNGNDILLGGDGNDKLYGAGGNDELYGGDGDDNLYGSTGTTTAGDILVGGYGKDNLQGGYGDTIFYDVLPVDAPVYNPQQDGNNDIFDGSIGNDTFIIQVGTNRMQGKEGDDTYKIYFMTDGTPTINTITETSGTDELILPDLDYNDPNWYFTYDNQNADRLSLVYSTSSGDTRILINNHFAGYDANGDAIFGINTFTFGDGTSFDFLQHEVTAGTVATETIYGTAGKDYIVTYAGGDTVYAGDADDYVRGGIDNDTLHGEAGQDFLFGYSGDDTLYGGLGDDRMNGEDGIDTLYGDEGADIIRGGDGDDTIHGGEGDDFSLYGDNGDDVVFGDEGRDKIYGGVGNDLLYGEGDGSETYAGERDIIYGGSDNDTLYGGGGSDYLYGDLDDDVIYGGDGDDFIYGERANNTTWNGNDTLYGGAGNDHIYGNKGTDVLYGQDGNDYLWGDAGADTFVFEAASAFNGIDNIQDFSVVDGDKVDLSELLTAYDPLTETITDFVQITAVGSDSTLSVDMDGGADNFVQIATFKSLTGLDVQYLEGNGNLLAA